LIGDWFNLNRWILRLPVVRFNLSVMIYYFSLTTNQSTVLSAMAYQLSEQGKLSRPPLPLPSSPPPV